MHAPVISRDVVIRQLMRLRLARNAYFGSIVVGAAIVLFIELVQDTHQVLAFVLMVPFVICVLVVVAAFVYLLTHRCPRCTHPFFWSTFTGNYFTSACLSCGVKLDGSNL